MRGINAAILITITDTVMMSTSVYFSGRLREAQNEAAAETQGILKVKPMQCGVEPDHRPAPQLFLFCGESVGWGRTRARQTALEREEEETSLLSGKVLERCEAPSRAPAKPAWRR